MAELEAAERLAAMRRKEMEYAKKEREREKAEREKEREREKAERERERERERAERRELMKIEEELIKKQLATKLAAIRDEDEESIHEDPLLPRDECEKVDQWLRSNPVGARGEEKDIFDEEPRPVKKVEVPLVTMPPGYDNMQKAVNNISEAMKMLAAPRPRHTDLPIFSGAPLEWLAFKNAVRQTTAAHNISPAENLQRLRSSLTTEVKRRIGNILYTTTDPEVIMRALERRYGQPCTIVDSTLEALKRLPKPGNTAVELNDFAAQLQDTIGVLRDLNEGIHLQNPLLMREVLDKLNSNVRSKWLDYAEVNGANSSSHLELLSEFLLKEADRTSVYGYTSKPSSAAADVKKESRREVIREARPQVIRKRPTPVYHTTGESTEVQHTAGKSEVQERPRVECPVCKQEHRLAQCGKFKSMTLDERWEIVKKEGVCFKCMYGKHRRYQCRMRSCGVKGCSKPHHALLHSDQREPSEEEKTEKKTTKGAAQEEAVMAVAEQTTTDKKAVLLKVCPVIIAGPRGEVKTYALFDEGATITLISEDLAAKVGAKGSPEPLRMKGVNKSTTADEASKRVTVHIRGIAKGSAPRRLQARTVKDLELHQQSIPAHLLQYEHLKDLPKNEVCYGPTRPELLVGTDHWECIVSRELRTGHRGQPIASRTNLGWVIHGTTPRSTIVNEENVLHLHEAEEQRRQHDDQGLHELVEAHFKIEALGVSQKPRVNEAHQRAEDIVKTTTKKIASGYEVGLPWKEDNVKMPPSYGAALRRLKKIEQKMDSSPTFAKAYTTQVQNLLDKGYAVPCDGTEQKSDICWYLPHFAVQNPNKPGKLRLVFDAAAKSHGVCLNDKLLEGPDLLLSLPGIIFRFRERAAAVTADIQEMFLRIKIRPEDQPAQQFLWRGSDREGPPRHFKMTSMIFGAASSPFMAHYVRNYNADLHGEEYPLALEAIKGSHYMDDLVASYDSPAEARRAVYEIRKVHETAGFTLRAWSSNNAAILKDVPPELHAVSPTQLGGGDQPESKILGLFWNAEQDELGFNTAMNRVPAEVRERARAPTKREALSAVMSIFDPLGLLSHFTIRAKIILQDLWRLQLGWDDPIPEEENDKFAAWLSQLNEIARLRLPRFYAPHGYGQLELHVMCDASEQAYATVAYWRIVSHDGSVKVVLVAAKSKVAPKKSQTIPRLELQAAVIGARLADTVRKEHRLRISRTIYWTDSSTVVHWIRNDARRYTPFVAHRLGEIAELTAREEWRWLPTEHNVADDATRLTDKRITSNDRWFRGPEFLYQPEEEWPKHVIFSDEEQEVLHITEEERKRESWLPDPARFSRYETMVRTAARVLMFIEKCRRQAKTLENRHILRAEKEILRQAQEESFGEEIRKLKASQPLSKSSRLYKLDPIMEDGLLRVRGRIGAATAPAEMKRPIILDGRHRVSKLIVQREHGAAGHANRERVINDLRQRYWVIHLRPTVRAVEKNCLTCRRRRATPQVPATGDLPRARLDPFHRPFTNCGVDYFGPMIVKVGRRREKRWGALFTCLTSRAVHIELVASLSTDSAIMALRRMAARRGWPKTMYSDNATNFKGADQELRSAYAEWAPALKEEGLLHRMEWRYIPPGAPNQGGAWERLIRSVKNALNATLNEKVPSDEVLRTLLTEAEFSINARPLTHVSVDPKDPEALTPNHFLLGSSTGLPTTGHCEYDDRRAWRVSQALANEFWRRWVREYLPTLIPRGEPQNNARNIKEGDIVIVVDGSLPRNTWPMGVVERTYRGPDGGIRVADVRTKTGIFKRPTRKLAVLCTEVATQAAPGGENVTDAELQ